MHINFDRLFACIIFCCALTLSFYLRENGDFLALDLGGSNFRVLWVKFKDGKSKTCMDVYTIPTEVMTGPGDQVSGCLCIIIIIIGIRGGGGGCMQPPGIFQGAIFGGKTSNIRTKLLDIPASGTNIWVK